MSPEHHRWEDYLRASFFLLRCISSKVLWKQRHYKKSLSEVEPVVNRWPLTYIFEDKLEEVLAPILTNPMKHLQDITEIKITRYLANMWKKYE